MRNFYWGYSGPCTLREFGGGPGIGGDGGSSTKVNRSISETKDASVTAGGDAYGGTDASFNEGIISVNSNEVAVQGLKTVEEIAKGGIAALFGARQLDTDLAEKYAEANANQSSATLSAIRELAETKITDGANLNQKTTMVALAIGGAVLLFSVLRRK